MEETAPESTPSSKGSQKGITTIIAIVIIALLVVGGVIVYGMNKNKSASTTTQKVGANSGNEMMQETQTPTETASSPSGAMMDGKMTAEKVIEVTGSNYAFSPKTITVKKGQKVTIHFKNTGGFHDFVLDNFKVKTDVIGSGKEATVSFTPDVSGTYQYYCSVGNHRAMGMVGTLTVE